MSIENIKSKDSTNASVIKGAANVNNIDLHGHYVVKCYDADGNLKWEDEIDNLVTTEGKNDILDKYLEGSSYTAAHYLGLIDNDSFSAISSGDTAASHSGWVEYTNYAESTRQQPSFSAASSGSKATSAAVSFTASGAGGTVTGSFLSTNSTKGTTLGVLFSVGQFTGGNKTLASGDIINVTYTASA